MSEFGFAVEGVSKRFGKTMALDAVSLSSPTGQVLGLLGPNGAGKTTLIRVLATLLRPDAGRAAVAGIDVARDPAGVRQRIAFSGQHTSVDEEMSGLANLVMIGQLWDLSRRQATQRAHELLASFGLQDAAKRLVGQYSGGMRRRLDLAVSLVGRPEVIFLDEPSVGLDPGKRGELWQMIRNLRSDGVSVLLTTQYLEEADVLADSIAVIDAGSIIAAGTPAELKQRVGGHTLDLRVSEAADVNTATAILSDLAGHAAEASGPDRLSVPVAGDEQFFAITDRLHAHGVGVAELALRLPGLDEVFLALTGTTTNDEPAEAIR